MRTGTGENGKVLFEGVLSSMIYVSATLGTLSTAQDVYAVQDKVTRADLAFERTSHIIGRVKGAHTESALDGTFSLEVAPGTWQVMAAPIDGSSGERFNERVVITAGQSDEPFFGRFAG